MTNELPNPGDIGSAVLNVDFQALYKAECELNRTLKECFDYTVDHFNQVATQLGAKNRAYEKALERIRELEEDQTQQSLRISELEQEIFRLKGIEE